MDVERIARQLLAKAEEERAKEPARPQSRRSPRRADEAPERIYCHCLTVLRAGACPRCERGEDAPAYCRTCLYVHAPGHQPACAPWTPDPDTYRA